MTKAQHHHLQLIAEQVGGLGSGHALEVTGRLLASQGLEATGQPASQPIDPSAVAVNEPDASEPKAQRPKGSKAQLPNGQEATRPRALVRPIDPWFHYQLKLAIPGFRLLPPGKEGVGCLPVLGNLMHGRNTRTALRDTLLPKLMSGEVRVEIETMNS
ncbi:MAG: hypothetical protein H6596_02365 [Flavobacteriales bacterium]|nr:hypothetical protein [Flavobacteriales bacterium]